MISPFNAPIGPFASKSSPLPPGLPGASPKRSPRFPHFQGTFPDKEPTEPSGDSFQPNKKPISSASPTSSPNTPSLPLSDSADDSSVNSFLKCMSRLAQQPQENPPPSFDIDPNWADAFGDTRLMSAAASDDTVLVNFLMTLGAEVNAQNSTSKKRTALILAIMANATACVDALLESPTLDINLPDEDGNTPLAYAVSEKNLEIVKKLLAKGANPNQLNKEGMSPLAHACQSNQPPMVQSLLRAGANPNLADMDGDTPLLIAIVRDNAEIIENLLSAGANPNQSNHIGLSPLARALAQQNKSLWNTLKKHGAQIDAPDQDGQTLLTRLCQINAPYYANLLLQWGGDVNQPNALGISPLREAILSRHPQVVAQLLAQPNLNELPDIQQAWQALKGEPQLSDKSRDKLAKHLTTPFFLSHLVKNPEKDLAQSFKQFRTITQNWQAIPKLQLLKRQAPQEYQQNCARLLSEIIEGEADAEQRSNNSGNLTTQLTHLSQEGEENPQHSSGMLPKRLMTGISSGFSELFSLPSTETIAHNLQRRLSELKQNYPAYWRQMRAGMLEQLFESHQAIRQARQNSPTEYLLACQAFLGMTLHCLHEIEQNPEFMKAVTPQAYQTVFHREISQALQNKVLNPELNPSLLHYLLTRPISE